MLHRFEHKPVRKYPVEKKIRTAYYKDHGALILLKTELGSYIGNAIGRATDKLLSHGVQGATMAHIVDEVSALVAAEIKMHDEFHYTIEINQKLPPEVRRRFSGK